MDMSEFDVIIGMDWLTVHRVVIECDHRRVTAYTQDGSCAMFKGDKHDALPQTVYDSRWHGHLTLVLCTHLKIWFLGFFSNWNHPNRITETQDMS